MILGTAGHIDHGKTSLIRALTGVDTDRLPEERRRGITIELGFAPLELEGVGTVGVVDVPGHEAFVRTMLAGATGIDLALLVVAADEGVMPQTREHVAILSLLGVRGGVVALTKRDLVDDEWLELVTEDVRSLLEGSPLANAAIVPTSVTSGAGLDALRAALAAAARAVPARDASDLFRMPVDRAFTVRGTGTVVTGTVWSGTLARDAAVRVLPAGRSARVRGVQSHGASLDAASPGRRAAVALAGLELDDVARGALLVSDPAWAPTRAIRADVALLDGAPAPLRARTRVRFHLGTVDVGARVVTAGGGLAPGERKPARIVLDEPVVARAGDRFVLRTASPVATVGGGVVTDPLPPYRRVRPWPAAGLSVDERLSLMLAEAGTHGIERGTLLVRLGETPAAARETVGGAVAAGRAVPLGGRLFAGAVLDVLGGRLIALVGAHHRESPLEPGASLQSVRAQLGAAPELVEEAIRRAAVAGDVEVEGGLVRRRGWAPRPSEAQRQLLARLAAALAGAGREPPSVGELAATHGPSTPALIRLLEREGQVVQVEPDRYYAATAVAELVGALRGGTVRETVYSPAELRDLLGISRKYLIPFLEYCDRTGVTIRRDAGREVASAGARAGDGT
ncbi:MAG TPA: selenocysteine-specific translation elongation factor [Gemmatimonadaceae bacterium]|nr:selenocysteine-specific translation elongation factor [Gemmatimonadaceae bacterium]